MSNRLTVHLDGQAIGNVERLRDGALKFTYTTTAANIPTATPLSVSMPRRAESYGHTQIDPWLMGLLPDNADVLQRWGQRFGVSVSSPYSLLGTQVGLDCAGAVQFVPAMAEAEPTADELIPLTEQNLAEIFTDLQRDQAAWLGRGFTGQFSLGGAQSKTALRYVDGQWHRPQGTLPTSHILKPAIPNFPNQHINEHLCLTAANNLDLPAARTAIETFGPNEILIIERYDRLDLNGTLTRIHQEDLCQALAVPPARKYEAEGGPSVRGIVDLFRRTLPDPETAVTRFVDALIYNWLIAGTDAHAKNYSLLLSGTQAVLAPLYDISSYLPYDESKGHKIKLAMKVGDDYKLTRTTRRSPWEALATRNQLNPSRVVQRAIELAQQTPGAFESASTTVSTSARDFAEQLTALVADRCESASRSLQ